MPLKTYLPQKFETTHENKFFRKFHSAIKDKYSNSENLHILLGNVNCNGHQIDAIFISSGKIVVIDFKNYGGKLEISTNDPWKIWNDNKVSFVSGGGPIRNPFQQLQAYRHSLMDFIGQKASRILQPNHDNFKIGHVNSCVLFHQKIEFDETTIPHNIKTYFHVADSSKILNLLNDIHSNNLILEDVEIENFIKELNINSDTLFIENITTADNADTKKIPAKNNINVDLIRKILPDLAEPTSNEVKLIYYYKTILELERLKELSVNNYYSYIVDWKVNSETLTLDIRNNKDFKQKLQSNINSQFPKNIFIGINCTIGDDTLPLMYLVVFVKDLNNETIIEENISQFTLHRKILEEMGLEGDLLDELELLIEQSNGLNEKIDKLNQLLGIEINLDNTVSVGLSEENVFSKQLQSELTKLIKQPTDLNNGIISNYLNNIPITNQLNYDHSPAIFHITKLNREQKEAVRLALSQPLTVITGPPGTGKTQVVINILANAIMNDKTVLFASKNNKAVDNVKQRLTELLEESDYLPRFGSKVEVNDKLKPQIINIINKRTNNYYTDQTELLTQRIDEYLIADSTIARIISLLDSIPILIKNIKSTKNILKIKEDEFNSWTNIMPEDYRTLVQSSEIEIKPAIINQLKAEFSYISGYLSGFKKIIFRIFLKKKSYLSLINIIKQIDNNIIEYYENNTYRPSEISIRIEELVYYYKNLIFLSESILKDKTTHIESMKFINQSKESIQKQEKKLSEILSKEQQFVKELERLNEDLPVTGKSVIDLAINQKLLSSDPNKLKNYLNYIPDQIPWKPLEVKSFENDTDDFLKSFNAVCITSLTLKNAFPLKKEMFDIVVIDEASQCDITSAIPLIYRAKQVVVIGDPLQLKHITKVRDYEEMYIKEKLNIDDSSKFNYVENSLYDHCFEISLKSSFASVFLKQHHRCHKEIIDYSSETYYLPRLGQNLEVMTNADNFIYQPVGFNWINIKGAQDDNRNINLDEVSKCVDKSIMLRNLYPDSSIGITTPFVHQADKIRESLPNNIRDSIMTQVVHKFQGDEKDIIIFSLVVTSNSPDHKADWINYSVPFLINVGVTRARSSLIIIGNLDYCLSLDKNTPLYKLARHAKNLNKVTAN